VKNIMQDRRYWLAWLVVLASFAIWQLNHLEGFQWNGDEGIDMLKPRLMRAGYDLYRSAYSDQPPGLTWSLLIAIYFLGDSMVVGRMVAVLYGTIGLLAVGLVARELGARWGAIFAMAAMAIVPNFFWLSRAVMLTPITMSLATLSLALALIYLRTGQRRWLVATGIAFSASLLVKLMPAFMVVPLAFILVLRHREAGTGGWLRPVSGDGLTLALVTMIPLGLTGLYYGPEIVYQVIGAYLANKVVYTLDIGHNLKVLIQYGQQNSPGLFFLAVYGLVILLARRPRAGWVMMIWFGVTVVALLTHAPLWRTHHPVLMLFPAASLAGVAFEAVFSLTSSAISRRTDVRATHKAWRRWLGIIAGLAAVAVYLVGLPATLKEDVRLLSAGPNEESEEAVHFVRALTRSDDVIISDEAIISYYADRLVPPLLADPSKARLVQGNLTTEELIAVTEARPPAAIVLWRMNDEHIRRYEAWVRDHYRLARSFYNRHKIYVPRDGLKVMTLLDVIADNRLAATQVAWETVVVRPGEAFYLVVDWQTRTALDMTYSALIRLVDDAGHIWSQLDQELWDVRGRPTRFWEADMRQLDLYALPVMPDTPPGTYQAILRVYAKEQPDQHLTWYSPNGDPIGLDYVLRTVVVKRSND